MDCENGRPLGLGKHPPPPLATQTEQYWCLTLFVIRTCSEQRNRLRINLKLFTGSDDIGPYLPKRPKK